MLARISHFVKSHFSSFFSPCDDLAEFGRNRWTLPKDWSKIVLKYFVYDGFRQRDHLERVRGTRQDACLAEAFAGCKPEYLGLPASALLQDGQNTRIQDVERRGYDSLGYEHIASAKDTPGYLRREGKTLVVRQRREQR